MRKWVWGSVFLLASAEVVALGYLIVTIWKM